MKSIYGERNHHDKRQHLHPKFSVHNRLLGLMLSVQKCIHCFMPHLVWTNPVWLLNESAQAHDLTGLTECNPKMYQIDRPECKLWSSNSLPILSQVLLYMLYNDKNIHKTEDGYARTLGRSIKLGYPLIILRFACVYQSMILLITWSTKGISIPIFCLGLFVSLSYISRKCPQIQSIMEGEFGVQRLKFVVVVLVDSVYIDGFNRRERDSTVQSRRFQIPYRSYISHPERKLKAETDEDKDQKEEDYSHYCGAYPHPSKWRCPMQH